MSIELIFAIILVSLLALLGYRIFKRERVSRKDGKISGGHANGPNPHERLK
jgi:hypothetical protein